MYLYNVWLRGSCLTCDLYKFKLHGLTKTEGSCRIVCLTPKVSRSSGIYTHRPLGQKWLEFTNISSQLKAIMPRYISFEVFERIKEH